MAGKSHPKKPLEDMMNNLKVETSSEFCNGNANSATPKEGSPSDTTSCISLAGDATSSFKESDVEQEALIAEQGMYYPASGYYGYYYPGFDGSFSEWDGHQCLVTGAHGLDAQYPAFQEDNGSIVYYTPGLQVGYSAFPPCAPGTVIGMDGQFMGQQPFLPSPTFPQPLTSPGYLTSPVPYSMEGVPTYPWEVFPVFGDGTHGNSFGGISTVTSPNMAPPKTNFSTAKTTNISKPKTLEKQSLPLLDIPRTNISIKHANKVLQNGSNFPAAALAKGYFPLQKLPGKSSLYHPNNAGHVKSNERGFIGPENIKSRSEMDGLNHFDLLNEQNRGPRITGAKTNLGSAFDTSISDSNGHGSIIRRDQYNLSDFRTEYDEALFYVIKSYSEDDIHKSIKYSGWASTSNGNKRLDNAYQAAHKKMEDKGSKCPIFLFFSVNASGQFCGVAEMIGRVDFDKNMDFWQQDKWNGFFPVKWHIIKDVPNPQFRHIRLENNDNRPVTNSRDTQEVKLPLGIEMLNIFKNYLAKTSILDDFEFYENRQKAMQDKRVRPLVPQFEYLQKKPDDVVQVVKAGKLIPTVLNQLPADFAAVNKSTEENQVATEGK